MQERGRQLFAVLVSTAAGTLAGTSFAPAGFALAAPAALLVLFSLVWRRDRGAFGSGLAFGFSFFLAGLWWIYAALSGHVGLPALAALFLTVMLCLALALFPAMALAAAVFLTAAGGLGRLLALAACWSLAEWLRSWLFTGFPWLMLGYSQIPDGWFAPWAPLAGILGVTLALALLPACLLALLLPGRRWTAVVILGVLLGGAPLSNSLWQWSKPAGTLRVSLLQGNVKQSLKWEAAAVEQALADYLRLAASAEGRIIIMPETALPMRVEDLPAGYLDALRAIADERLGAVITGVFLEDAHGIYNAALVLEKNSTADYRKIHLTPYGEYLPAASILKPLLGAASIPYSNLSAGSRASPLPLPDGVHTAISICYEDVFGNEWRRQAPAALFLTNLTNDAWFDSTMMPHQHLQMAQARALESGRWLVRATNTGITAIVNAHGRIVAQLPQKVQGVLTEEIVLRRGVTPYVLLGDSTTVALALLILAGVAVLRLHHVYRRWRRQK